MRWFAAALVLVCGATRVYALPNMMRLGYANCVSCHVAPQGGGLLTSYGRGIDEAQSWRVGEFRPGASEFLNRLSLNGRIDQDFRIVASLQLSHSPGGPYQGVDRMRFFYRNVTMIGKGFRVSAVVDGENDPAQRKAQTYDPVVRPGHVLVASALLQYRRKEGIEIAAGRDALPTGLNIPDQTTFIKARNRSGYFDAPVQAKAFLWSKRWSAVPFVFAPAGRWDVARQAWQQCAISIPRGDGPIEMNLGHVPIRLTINSDGEVVWCRRIDPARAVLVNVPLPDSGHRWGDLILHDGAANGYRMLRGEKVPVFDELVCLAPSEFVTFIVELEAATTTLESLSSIADELGGAAEDWSTTTRVLCKECSEGTPGHYHDAGHSGSAHPHCGLAARDEVHAQQILNAWLSRVPGSRVVALRSGRCGGSLPSVLLRNQSTCGLLRDY